MADFVYGNCFAWRFCSSSSKKLLLFIVPLIVISGFFGPRNSNWVSLSGLQSTRPWLWGYSVSSNSSSSSSSSNDHLDVKLLSTKHADERKTMADSNVVMGVQDKEESLSNDSVLNSSVSPSLPVEAVHAQEPEPQSSHSMNESVDPPMKAREPKVYTNLERLESGLQKARAAIRDARNGNQTTPDHDYVPQGPMYRNANVFHRSYSEMEKQFKVYVYKEGEPPVFHNGPCKSIYSTEGFFINRMEVDKQFRTEDPEKAHVFFLPFSVTMMVRFVYIRDTHDFGPIRRTVIDYVNLVAGRYPYWNRSLGADHFMLSCHDWGPEASLSVPNLQKNSIRALCNANTSERFNPIKDVSFPEINLQTGTIKDMIGGPSPSQRSILAFFAGGVHGPIRPVLLEHWEGKDEDIQVFKYLPKGISYYAMMRKTKFCLCPSGYEVASPRIVEAIYTGCVPVLISDHYTPPFSDVLNWKSFSVEVSVSDIPNLKRILMRISSRQYIRMQRRVVQVRKHFELNYPPKRLDVFHMILHSVWLRRLNVRIQDM
ncbi:probable glycosyltransferase At5g03795 isoform X3 [Tripterygium wilfordii]|uniref:probable glycosyltransferase At5g03795 isoform X3 n=1 Tax=Tripterygium wilfordii TaxID=458696 RepID=UPI0018F7EB4E|nr:probable glycosyltransferase At5g03795 isoform X3 [Tripterygium wilfordii]